MCAMIEKLRMWAWSATGYRVGRIPARPARARPPQAVACAAGTTRTVTEDTIRTPLAAAVAAALITAGTAAAPAAAFRLGGAAWPGGTISYHDATGYKADVRAAVRTWNESGARVRLRPAARSRARVRIVSGGFGCSGVAQLGYARGQRAVVRLGRGCNYASLRPGIVAHELGHILGLAHEDRRCATMNTILHMGCGGMGVYGSYRCRILEADDVRGAVRRYGGRVRPLRANPICPVFSAPQAPAVVLAHRDRAVQATIATTAPRRLVDDPGPPLPATVHVWRYAGTCPARAGAGQPFASLPADYRSATYPLDWSAQPGTWCYAFAVEDIQGRRSPLSTASIVVAAPPSAPDPYPYAGPGPGPGDDRRPRSGRPARET